MKFIKIVFIYLVLVATNFALEAKPLKGKEIISFRTEQGSFVRLFVDEEKEIIVFNFFSDSNLIVQYPEKIVKAEPLFTYSFYLRGGFSANEGLDLNFLQFIFNDIKYVIYETSYYDDLKVHVGLKMIDLKTGNTKDLKAVQESIKGTLLVLRDSNLVLKGDEYFEW